MFRYFAQLRDLFLINPALFLKALFWGGIVSWLGWHFVLKRPFYQQIYGKPTDGTLEIWDADIFQDMPEQSVFALKVNGYDIEVQAIKSFKTVTRIVYVDRYTPLGTWYRSREGARLYDKIVPQDISTATGITGRNPQCFKYAHEYRLLTWEWDKQEACPIKTYAESDNDVNNNHSIAASQNVQRGLDILKAGDIAYIEGYAVYWNGTGNLRYQRFESATVLGQVSTQLAGGQKTGLCRQLLITKITFDGYTFE